MKGTARMTAWGCKIGRGVLQVLSTSFAFLRSRSCGNPSADVQTMYHLRIDGIARVPWIIKICLGELSFLTWIPSSAIHLTGSSSPTKVSWLIYDLRTISFALIYQPRSLMRFVGPWASVTFPCRAARQTRPRSLRQLGWRRGIRGCRSGELRLQEIIIAIVLIDSFHGWSKDRVEPLCDNLEALLSV